MSSNAPKETNRFYLAAWRWHFYAGLFVVPFLLVLATTGMAMLLSRPLDEALNSDRLRVDPVGEPLSPREQVAAAEVAFPGARVAMYIPPVEAGRSAQVSLVPGEHMGGHAGHQAAEAGTTQTVFIDPYRGTVLGSRDPLQTPYAWASRIHGTLLLGTVGDLLLEVAAGFGILLIATGVFLWWPRNGEPAVFWSRLRGRRRLGWRDLHAAIGIWTSSILTFFLLSGLAWTVIWGGQLVQGFNSLPPPQMESLGAAQTHESLNTGPIRQVPWVLEQTPMPQSGTMAGLPGLPAGMSVGVNSVVAFARDNGFTGYRVNFPQDSLGVWTVAAATMSKDISDPRRDRTLHIDQYTGRVLADYQFAEYPVLGKAMAAGIALHQGDIGPVNMAANIAFCLAVIALCVSGVVMWWMRRPAGELRLAPPPVPRDARTWRKATVVMFVVSLAFPLAAATLALVALLDLGVVSRLPALRTALK